MSILRSVEESLGGQLHPAAAPPAAGLDHQPFGARAFLASIVESSDDSIIGTDLSGRILSWNRGAQRMFGYPPQEALGQRITLLFPPDRQLDYANTLEKVQGGEEIQRYESVRVAKDGTRIDVGIILSPVRDRSGGLIGVSAIYRDITLRNLRDEELLRAKEAAEAANRAKSEFLANMSHEIRTPMNGVLGMTDVLLDTELTDEQREYLAIVKYSGNALLTIINDILDLSKIEANKFDLLSKEVRVRDLVEATVREMAVLARAKGLKVSAAVEHTTPDLILADPVRLRQVLVNLVSNAIKFSEVGSVEIAVRPENTTLLHFQVRDTGPGIPPEKQGMIFDAFAQIHSSTMTRAAGGSGLGLAIAARLVTLMGGRIWVESDGHTGSTFHFTIDTGDQEPA